MLASKRGRWIIQTISDSLHIKDNVVEDFLKIEKNEQILDEFLQSTGPKKIYVYFQVDDIISVDGIREANQDPSLFITQGETERLKNKAVYFVRNLGDGKKSVNLQESNDNEIIYGELSPNILVQLNNMMELAFQPMIDSLDTKEWGQCEQENIEEFQNITQKFTYDVNDAIKAISPGQEIFQLDADELTKFQQGQGNESEKTAFFERKFSQWLNQINNLLNDESDQKKETPDAGPRAELEYWKGRMQKITSWCEQIKGKDFQMVKNYMLKQKGDIGNRGRGEENISKLILEYNKLELLLTDRLNEAKDNVKYLSTLEKFIDPLYNGSPQQIIDTLPALMNAIKMIHTIARFYNTADKMTNLFMKITNQMIKNCKKRILDGKKDSDIWNRDPQELIQVLSSCIKLNKEYKDCYKETKEKVADMPKGKTFDFSETQIFGKFDLFCRRVLKLIEIFNTILQFQSLAKHNLEGMEKLTNRFKEIIDDFKRKRHELLDYQNNQFDRYYVSFNVEISHLDVDLQNFIDNNFNRFRNIEYSLKLLHKFENTLKRDSLKHNLTTKYNAILHNYATDLDNIQRVFQDQKADPPIVRNMPEQAGKIIWARHLFQKITGPINMFPENVINSNEIKKYYASYNNLGKMLTVYEMWFLRNWVDEIEKSKAALQATLIVRHEENKKLYVNFDLEIMQLIREAKCMDRVGIEIPESARIILLQEEKFKMYYNELQYVLKEYERIISKIKPITKTLLCPHVEDLELKLRPGMVTLTWTSMNIDSYLQHVHQGLKKLEQLIINVNDIIENRVENNLKNVSKILLVSLPQESGPFSLEQFVQLQEQYIKSKTEFLISKNVEVERAVDDLLQTILLYPLDPHVNPVLPEETKRIKRYYFWYLYQALLNSTQNSLNAMKYRVCGIRQVTGNEKKQSIKQALKPFFEVQVQLDGQSVILNPNLQEIQKAINRAATAVLRCSKTLYNWEQQDKDADKKVSFYEMIAQDKEIVKVILLLTGSIQGTKNKVNDFLQGFVKFEWLWKDSIPESLKKFEKKIPTLQDYEDELKKFASVEEDIDKIELSHIIGAMELKTENLSSGLKAWARDWKLQYAQDLHKRARSLLDGLTEQTKLLDTRLKKEVKDIDSLGYVMEALEDIRKQQAEIDMKFNPVQDMYALLDNYLPGGISDKDEMDARSMLKRNWDQLINQAEVKQKELQQKQSIYLKELKSNIKEFIKDVQDFRKDYETEGPMVENIAPKEAIQRLRRFEDEFILKQKFFQINKKGEDLFGLHNQKYTELEMTESEIKNLKKLYSLYAEVIDSITKWKEKAWSEIGVENLKDMEDQITKYGDLCIRLPRDLKEWQAYKELKLEIDNLKEVLPIIIDLKKPSIKVRHWQKICEVTGKDLKFEQEDMFYLSDLMEAGLLDHLDDIIDITESADKQLKIEQQLDEIKQTWDNAIFEFSNWGKSRDYPCILNGMCVQTIQEKLEEDSMTMTTLNAQRHVTPFKPVVENQIRIFSDVTETLDMWIKVQILWTSLEAVFMSGDIARQMPAEAKKFQGIDKNWLRIMEKAVETKKVIPCCQNDMLKDFLPDLQKNLELCQKSLEQYLEGKRKKFPRFYFVSNPTLLKILSQGSEPTSIQEDFEKLFDAINKVTFDKNPEKKGSNEKIIRAITQVVGQDEETIELGQYVKCEGNIESWLASLEHQMQETVKDIIRAASGACFSMSLREFIKAYASQVSLLGIQMIWTTKMQEAFERLSKNEKQAMEAKKKEVKEMMEMLSMMCLEPMTSCIERTKIETLVTIMVHQKDITHEIKCKDVNDFEWQKQTRIYWKNEQDCCIISITDWDCPYSNEFLGAKERLCITPLTDRCYITLAQAMSMFYGGAPAGPAGTGKTETVKDLGRTLGIFVVVTNCSDQHRYKDMAKIFKGLVQSGLWGCFDEFNRIHLEVLSVVAMQVEAINAAKKAHLKEFMFPEEPNPIEIKHTVGYFITMNPGYAGRQELPENLKVLFRSVSMMVPDREIIIKVKLASVGYLQIDALSKKFNILYKLCEEQLSKQRHYDFGLRNILSVLRTAGNTKRQEPKSEEEMLLMRSLRDMNLSKLVAEDIPLFESLLEDIFPKQTDVPKKLYKEVEQAVEVVIKRKGLINHPSWVLKIIQLYETCLVRHGFMLVGPTGSGKSTIMQTLTEGLTDLGQPYKLTKMNPKAITTEEMYGVKSEISDDWIPGIFSTVWQKSNQRSSKFNTWIVFDGPVDTIWIESLNTVLDDNKILTLANGERIPMTENCKLVFEVENLNNASPATVSRCGQVYVSPTDLGYMPLIQGWVNQRKMNNRGEEAEKISTLLNKYLGQHKLLEILDKICKSPVIECAKIIHLTNTLNLVAGQILPLEKNNRILNDQEYEKIVVYALTWAIGGIYEVADRQLFHEWLLQKGAPLPPKSKENETVYDYWLHLTNSSLEWKYCVPDEWKPPEKIQFSQLLLPTVDSMRAELLLNYILNQPKNSLCYKACLLIGGSGTAKTSSVLMYAQKFQKDVMLFKRINFSSATTPATFQANIEVECDYKIGKDFAPPGNKQLTVFIDDMSMPFVNKWGDQETLEIVRQLVDTNGFYMLDKTQRGNFKNLKNLQYIGAMNQPGGGRNDIPNRCKRIFFMFNMILPLSVEAIYGPIIKNTFKAKYFSNEFNKVIDSLPNATVKLWNKVKNTLLPTPSKFHYVFNMRDLSRIFKGVLQVRRDIINSSSSIGNMKPEVFIIGLWRHECERVFVDKLTNDKDKQQVINYIQELSLEGFPQLENDILEKLNVKEKPIYFCDFLREDIKNEEGIVEQEAEKLYEAINEPEKLRARCYQLLEEYNIAHSAKKMNLVIFDDALKHLLRISRAIQQSRSSALLVGVGGSGKQSLTRLASFIGKQVAYQIVITKSFGEKDFKEELKVLFDYAGHLGKPTTFIMTDSEVKKEEFLEYINMILSTGEVPGLIAKDEREVWLGDIRADYIKERGTPNVDPPASDLYAYFVDRLRDNLHIVLCFSPVGQKFRERSRKFPALFAECTIDWFLPWPEEALISVAQTFIQNFKELDTKKDTKVELYKHMGQVHLMVTEVCEQYFHKMRRQVYVTPKSFLSYLNSYKDLYMAKYFGQLDVQEKNYTVGLQKIAEASSDIAKMEIGLKDEEIQLNEASEKTRILLNDLEKESKKAKIKNDEVEATTQACKKQAEQISAEKEDAERDLAAALPALKRAQDAVDSLDSKDIVELKTNRKPLDIIKYILDSVIVFFQQKLVPVQIEEKQFSKKEERKVLFLKDSFEECGQAVLNEMNFMKNLKFYEKDGINDEIIELLEPYMSQQNDWFNEVSAQKVSKAAAGILKWSLAIYEYHEKSKIVKPKKINLAIQEGRLTVAQTELAKAQKELAEIQAYLGQLKETFSKQMKEKEELENKSNKTKKKINTARTLINSLSGEKERWGKGKQEIGDEKRRLVGNVSMACAFISYCGPFNAEFRHLLSHEYFTGDMKKKGIPVTPGLDLINFLVDDATVGEWNIQGLPKDDLSIQNGIMVTNSTRYPLLIDPQGQGQGWIQNKYSDSIEPERCITTLNHPKFKDLYLKYCMEEGKTLIIEGIENEVDPMLDPVLEKQIQVKGKTCFIDVGGTQIEYHKQFLCFMICRLPNPSFSPELSAKTTIIDFTVTQSGLEQQLLGRVLSKEQKALEDSLNQLLADVNFNKRDLQRLDKNLLDRLTSSQGNLLDDTELVDVLNSTKLQASEVSVKLADAEVKTKEINEKREQYRPVAIRGSALYFVMIEMSLVNWMYNSSLEQFLKLFDESIDDSEKPPLPSKRVETIIKYLTFHVYKYVNRGLFERDKITYILMICFKILTTGDKKEKKMNNADISQFLKSGAALDIRNERAKPSNFLTDKAWLNILALSRHHFGGESLAFYRELPDSISRNEAMWKQWIEKNDPENYPIPDFGERINTEKEIGPFINLCTVRSIREDRTIIATTQFIKTVLGKEFTEPVAYPLDETWAESTAWEPILFLLSLGADPTSSIDELARKKKKYPYKVSMGEGQEKVAMQAINDGFQDGSWIVLQNCHLGLQFMEQIVSILSPDALIHEEFRLWITCEPHLKFPLSLLQRAIKVTNEPPKGLKAGLHKTFSTMITQDFLDKVDHPSWKCLIFTMCFLHSIVQERRKFGPLGWCVPYEYNNSDLEASLCFIEKYLSNLMAGPTSNNQSLGINCNVIKYMVCEVQYGGRITDDLDRELFQAYGDDYIKEGIFGNEYTFIEVTNESAQGGKEKFRYKIPANQSSEISKYREYVDTVPAIDNTEVFGLHSNADLTFRLKESVEMINTIMETRPKDAGGGGGGKTREEIVQDKSKEILQKLPPDYNMNEVYDYIKKLYGPKQLGAGPRIPSNVFLKQEIQRMQNVISMVRKTCQDIIDAIDGQIIMTPIIVEAIDSIADAKVPPNWVYDATGAEISWLLPNLGGWIGSLVDRNLQLSNWLKNGRPNTFWLTGFFNPQGFLTAMKQEVTRINKQGGKAGGRPGDRDKETWSLDDVVYQTQVKDREYEQIRDPQQEGVYIHGLYLEGCRWYRNGLDDPEPKKMFAPLPILYVTAINKKKSPDAEKMSSTYSCPVYKYPKRTDKYLIFRVGLPCEGSGPHRWKLRGVALLCSTE